MTGLLELGYMGFRVIFPDGIKCRELNNWNWVSGKNMLQSCRNFMYKECY